MRKIAFANSSGRHDIGTHMLSTWPTVVELVGHTGQYDYVEFSAEYARSICTNLTILAERWSW